VEGAVSCLPGRMLAIRTPILKKAVPALVCQKFLGAECISGDDRFLTSYILGEYGLKTVYVSESVVYTNAPDTLRGFVLQRLRWSRTSLRETLRSLPWIFKYPYCAFTVLSNVILRWFFFTVIMVGLANWFGLVHDQHYLSLSVYEALLFSAWGFMISGFFKQLRHLIKYPKDIAYLPFFLLVTTFILTPVEWVGNLTLRESGWMTRRVK
jgi:hyaluronan synthase